MTFGFKFQTALIYKHGVAISPLIWLSSFNLNFPAPEIRGAGNAARDAPAASRANNKKHTSFTTVTP